jgi:hypothetical protein
VGLEVGGCGEVVFVGDGGHACAKVPRLLRWVRIVVLSLL